MQFALKTAVWNQMRCPYFTGYPHFTGLPFTGFTVLSNGISTIKFTFLGGNIRKQIVHPTPKGTR
jgi:hypothetical protein